VSAPAPEAWDFYAHDIEACPFCGGLDLEPWDRLEDPTDPESHFWHIWCKYCGTEGPVGDTPQQATEYWNKRD
jgi:Lar family restriction alleviation protein